MSKLENLTISQAHKLLTSKQVSATELVNYYIDRIKKIDDNIKSIITLCQDQALAQAKKVDQKISKGEQINQLEGIPYLAKDMFSTKGILTTAASNILKNYKPPFSATAIKKLEAQGAILIGKTNQDEFAHGGSTENSGFFKTANPWDKSRVPGGSSGGSAAAVAADFCVFSLGTDTGGSIREPASFCGVTGFKPTYGVVSRYGVIAMASSFDCIGPLTKTAEDSHFVMQCIAGQDSKDATTVKSQFSHQLKLPHNYKVGIVKDYTKNTVVTEFTKNVATEYIEIEEIDQTMALAAYYVLVPSEISSNLERYDGVRYGSSVSLTSSLSEFYSKTRAEYFGSEPKRRILTGTYALSSGYYDAYYKKAMQIRRKIVTKFDELFTKCDFIIMPTTLGPAFEFGAKSDLIEMYKTDLLTVTANIAGLPAISIPAGVDDKTGLPLGLQIISKQLNDQNILALANEFQKSDKWHKKLQEIKL